MCVSVRGVEVRREEKEEKGEESVSVRGATILVGIRGSEHDARLPFALRGRGEGSAGGWNTTSGAAGSRGERRSMRAGNFRAAVILLAMKKKRRNWLTLALMRWTD